MPLPTPGIAWPPKELTRILDDYATWDAWYSGDTTALRQLYLARNQQQSPSNRPSQFRGGVVGVVARTFWGAPKVDLSKPDTPKLHVPVAADICQASADLLFSEPPTVTVDDDMTNERLQELIGDGLLTTLAESAEIAAALGGVYLRVTWDKQVRPDAPFLSKVDVDGAWPEFRWSQLVAVTFWTVVRRTDTTIWRHLERHELTADGVGVVLHGLYQGTADNLGRLVPLTDSAATAGLADFVANGDTISTESPGLAVVYVPNQRPQRRWRKDPLGRNLGRADLDGIEPLMDQLDEAYTSWMRDLRLGKARVFVAQSLLQDLGPGQGTAWDSDAEVYSPINALPPRETSGLPLEAHQFAIRYQEHQATCQELFGQICLAAGYSVQTFGESGDTAMTATEVQARERRSFSTRDRKIRLFRPALADIVEKLLAVDRSVFGSDVTPGRPDVAFPDGVQESMLSLAQTAQALKTAGAASTEVLVELVHPDWDDEQVTLEVQKILDETGMSVPDPFPGESAAGALDPAATDGAPAGQFVG